MNIIDQFYVILNRSSHESAKLGLIDYFKNKHPTKDIKIEYIDSGKSIPCIAIGGEWIGDYADHLFKCSYVTFNDPIYEKLSLNSDFHTIIEYDMGGDEWYSKENPWVNTENQDANSY